MQTKAVSAVIATIMLLMISTSLIGVFYAFSSGMIGATASTGTAQVSQAIKQVSSCVRIDNMNGNQIYLRNCGAGVITNESLGVYVDSVKLNISMNTIPENSQGIANITTLPATAQGSHNLQITSGMGSDAQAYSSLPKKGTESNPGASCADIFSSGFLPSSGNYWISEGSLFRVFCDMTTANKVPSDSWTIGSGSVGIFGQNGNTSENSREFGIGPYGNTVILWKGGNDEGSSADGGWTTSSFPIDNTKTYRISVWINKTNSNYGSTYLGVQGGQVFATTDASKTILTNPYIWVGDLPSLNGWYLVVGYINGSQTTGTTGAGGIYNKTDGKVASFGNDFRFTSAATTQVHRTYLYYDTNIDDRQYFWGPRFEEVNGMEPSINALLGVE